MYKPDEAMPGSARERTYRLQIFKDNVRPIIIVIQYALGKHPAI
jgi:hypothetical protein